MKFYVVVTNNVKKLQFKSHQNQIRLRGVNTCSLVIGTSKKTFFGHSRHHHQSNYDILLKTVEQTWLMIKNSCEIQIIGGVEESQARNHLLNIKKKSEFFCHFYFLAFF